MEKPGVSLQALGKDACEQPLRSLYLAAGSNPVGDGKEGQPDGDPKNSQELHSYGLLP